MWAFATLTAALEAGLLEQLADPQELGAISARSGLDPSLTEGVLDSWWRWGWSAATGSFSSRPQG